jgi:hypothetical protein
MAAIGCFGYKGTGLDRTKTIASKVPADLVIAQWLAPVDQFLYNPSNAIATPVFSENRYDLSFPGFFFRFRLIGLPGFPRIIATPPDL